MYDHFELTAAKIEAIRISRLPITNGNLIYKALSQSGESAATQIHSAFKKLLSLDDRYNPIPNIVYRFEVGEMNSQYPMTYIIHIHNQITRKRCSFVLDKKGIDILSGN